MPLVAEVSNSPVERILPPEPIKRTTPGVEVSILVARTIPSLFIAKLFGSVTTARILTFLALTSAFAAISITLSLLLFCKASETSNCIKLLLS